MTLKEAADALGLPKQTVRNWYLQLPDNLRQAVPTAGGRSQIVVTDAAFAELQKHTNTKTIGLNQGANRKTDGAETETNIRLTELAAEVTRKDEQLAAMGAELRDKTAEISRLKAQIENLRGTIDDLHDAAKRSYADLDFLKGQITAKDAQIDALQQTLDRTIDQEQQLHAQTIARIPARKTISEWVRGLLPAKHEE